MAAEQQVLIVGIIYMVLLLLFGFYQGRKVKSGSDFSIGGRNLPGWVAALSERATGESGWALLGLPGAAYATGLMEIWTAIGCVLGVIVSWSLLALRLRNEAEKYQANTFTEYIAKRHAETEKWIKVAGSLTIVFFFFFYVGAQFLGGGKALFTLFEAIRPEYGMLIMAVLIVPYTVYGGFRSVAYTDVVQAIIMLITLVIGPIVGIMYLKSHPEMNFFATNIGDAISFSGEKYSSLAGGAKGFVAGVAIFGGFAWFFGFLGGQPQLTTRFMAIKNPNQAKSARNIGIIWTILAYTGALAIGWIGLAMYGPGTLEDREYVLPMVVMQIFPPVIAGILITGVLAAIISTANSLLIVSSTELSENLLKKAKTEKKNLFKSRLTTAILSLIALGVAYLSYSPLKFDDKSEAKMIEQEIPATTIDKLGNMYDMEFLKKEEFDKQLQKTLSAEEFKLYADKIYGSAKQGGTLIFSLVSYVWAGIGCTFSVIILLTLFWRKFHGRAAFLTIIAGMLFTIIWISTGMEEVITSRIMTFVVAGLTAVLSTYFVKPKKV
jgi:sodium/proline symporter